MKKKLIIFGAGDIAELAHFYFSTDTEYDIVAFSVDSEYLTDSVFCGLPVISFQHITSHYPPDQYELFIALSYARLNELRMEKYFAAKAMGYSLASYISSYATVLNTQNIGDNCFILEDNTIQPFVSIGNNVTLWSGNHIGHHSTIKDHCFIASHVVISGGVEIGSQSFIGVNATLRDHIKVGDKCVIGAGTLLLSDVQSEGLYIGVATARAKLPSTRIKKI